MSKTNGGSLWAAAGLLAVLVGFFAITSSSHADQRSDAVAKAVAYLKSQGEESAKTMALVAAGEQVDVSYLKSFSGSTAIEYTKPIMAVAAAGENPAIYPSEDFVAKLKTFSDGTQMGSASQINDDIWGILALRAAGLASSDAIVQSSKAFVLGNQSADGGWAWNVGGASDTNDTAAAIMALLEVGMSKNDSAIQRAVSYLKGAQNEDGGFPYDPKSEFATDSDGNSDAWVMMAFNKLGEDVSSVAPHLLSLQDTDGGFWWMTPPVDFNNKGATADAVIALSGKSFPVKKWSGAQDTGILFRIVGSTGEVCKATVFASNAMEVVVNAASQCGYTYEIQDTSFGPYLAAVNNDKAEGLKGWMYAVNNIVPSIGAADYALSGGERVVWFYGEFGDNPPASESNVGAISDSVNLSVEVLDNGTGGTEDNKGGMPPEIAFSVHPASLDFGKLVPGNSVVDTVSLRNEGQKNLSVWAEVEGDSTFGFLQIENALWDVFTTLLAVGEQKSVGVTLSVPVEFNSFGQKQGTLIFWAEAN